MSLSERIKSKAFEIGFDLAGIAPVSPSAHADAYRQWIDEGAAAGMQWLTKNVDQRMNPSLILPGARTVVVVGLSYFVENPPPEIWNDPSRGRISRFAWGRDYHEVLRPMLDELAAFIRAECGATETRTYVDAGPLLERDLAEKAGLGSAGKNTNLIHPGFGSYFFLGEVLVNVELETWNMELGIPPCGPCALCLKACPAGALTTPYHLDARRCISYLTIEHRGPIPEELRPNLGHWIFGCDECQQVCPWNLKLTPRTIKHRFLRFMSNTCAPELVEIMKLQEPEFKERFAGTPVLRAKRSGFLRNVAVALGNWGDAAALPALEAATHDGDPLVREHALWAIGQIRKKRQ